MLKRGAKLLLALACRAADLARAGLLRIAGRRPPGRLVVLGYHAVPDRLAGRFRRQVEAIAQTSTVLPPGYTGPLAPGGRYAMITFDDGCRSVVRNALPALGARGLPCALFAVSGALGGRPHWITDPADPQAGEALLTGPELGRLDPARVAVGSHGATHRSFLRMGAADAAAELEGSRRELSRWLGREVDLFAFPHGEHDPAAERLALAAGYRRLFGLGHAAVHGRVDAALLPRFDADPADWAIEFRLKLLGAYRWLPAAFRLKRRLRGVRGDRRPAGRPPEAP